MKVLIDAVHPADVWTLGAIEDRLLANGEETLWISRPEKDSVVELIEARGRPQVKGPKAGTSRTSLAYELVARDWRVWRTVRSFKPAVILTRSPAGVHIGRLTRTPVLYDTDDGHVAGLLYSIAGPFADIITTPTATEKTYGKPHRRYQGYKELFYLHPNRFEPDPGVRNELGLNPDERFSVLRLTGFTASHDTSEAGMNRQQIDRVIDRLSTIGRVLISSEQDLVRAILALPVDEAVALVVDIADVSTDLSQNERAFYTTYPVELGTPVEIELPNPTDPNAPTLISRQSKLFVQAGDIRLDSFSVGLGFRYRY